MFSMHCQDAVYSRAVINRNHTSVPNSIRGKKLNVETNFISILISIVEVMKLFLCIYFLRKILMHLYLSADLRDDLGGMDVARKVRKHLLLIKVTLSEDFDPFILPNYYAD